MDADWQQYYVDSAFTVSIIRTISLESQITLTHQVPKIYGKKDCKLLIAGYNVRLEKREKM